MNKKFVYQIGNNKKVIHPCGANTSIQHVCMHVTTYSTKSDTAVNVIREYVSITLAIASTSL